MKIPTLIVCLLLFTTNNLICQNWNGISKEIKDIQLLDQPNVKAYINCYYNLRNVSNSLKHIHVTKRDTIFMLESYGDWSSLELKSIVWNNTDMISYTSNDAGKSYVMAEKKLFTNYMVKLVSEWNIEEIKKEEKLNRESIPQYWVYATRIIINGKKHKIDCIYFKDFFDLQRDGMDFSN